MKESKNITSKTSNIAKMLLEGPTEEGAERELCVVTGTFPSYSATSETVENARSEIADLRERVKALEQLVQKLEQYRQNQILYE